MRRFVSVVVLAVIIAVLPAVARAGVVARISLSTQTMQVYVDGAPKYSWAVSAARKGYRTPVGSFRPTRMHRTYYSQKYDNAPMPHSIFFHGGYAIHGTTYVNSLGQPASHGCIRLHPANAAALFSLVQRHGPGNTRIVIIR
ncbi:L,D-transpeptidase-like protein [Tepidamorphus gemmatus]|uniref:L,D-transpeptidase-like protein n=1 Tax=Tepidamorphus gemmatus TaxID=747076 RepID=A0A4R3MAM1_9HYPH|nr:L,D-transpeptidase [Tepidamorphus gemmatus]TCT10540.1 L,D-transpeptidase-like protein [Tepidamorphus gemmatus]